MNVAYGLLPDGLLWFANVVFALVLGAAVRSAPWRRLREGNQLHVFLGATVFLVLLWSLNAGIQPGLNFHLLGATLLTLMFGWQLALVSLTFVLIGVMINAGGDWATFSLNGFLMAVVPVAVSQGVYRWAIRSLPHHFFVYVIVNAYFCAALAMASTLAFASLMFVCCSPYTFSDLTDSYLPFAPLIMFAEAFFTGMLAASMALMRPEWIWTFDDSRYLAGK